MAYVVWQPSSFVFLHKTLPSTLCCLFYLEEKMGESGGLLTQQEFKNSDTFSILKNVCPTVLQYCLVSGSKNAKTDHCQSFDMTSSIIQNSLDQSVIQRSNFTSKKFNTRAKENIYTSLFLLCKHCKCLWGRSIQFVFIQMVFGPLCYLLATEKHGFTSNI